MAHTGFGELFACLLSGVFVFAWVTPVAARVLPDDGFPTVCNILSVCSNSGDCLNVTVPVQAFEIDQDGKNYVMRGVSENPFPVGIFPSFDAAAAYLEKDPQDRAFGTVLIPSKMLSDATAFNVYSVVWQAGHTTLSDNFTVVACTSHTP